MVSDSVKRSKYLKVYRTKWVDFYHNQMAEIIASGIPTDGLFSGVTIPGSRWCRVPEWVKMAVEDWESTGGGGMTLGEYLALIKG